MPALPKLRQHSPQRRIVMAGVFVTVLTIWQATSALRTAQAAPAPAAPSITASPSGTTVATSRSATFSYSSPTTVNFRCSLDAAAYVACPAAAGKTASVTYTGLADGLHTFRVIAVSGSAQSTPTVATWTIDATPPRVTEIVRLDQSPHGFGTVRWRVTFTEPVSNLGLANFSLSSTGLGGSPALLSISPASGPAATYIVSATSGSGTPSANPTLRLNFASIGTVRDAAGNLVAATFTGETYVFFFSTDTTAPLVTLTTVNGSTVVHGSPISFPLTMNEQVSTIGGTCGTISGDAPSVTVTLAGPSNRSGSAPCAAGTWTFALSPALLNLPAGINDGSYTITVTQPDNSGNVGTTGPKILILATRAFTVVGNAISTLRPGTVSDLALTINNPYPFALKIEAINVAFVGTGPCNGPANFTVSRPFAGPITVPAGATVLPSTVSPQIKMLNRAVPQDGCKLASISLNYSGLASRA